MPYRHKSKNNWNGRRRTVAIVAFFIFFILLVNWFAPRAFSRLFFSVATPFWRLKHQVVSVVGDLFSVFRSKLKLQSAVNDLEDEVRQLQLSLADRDLLLKENLELREFLDRKKGDSKRTLAMVFAKPPFIEYDSIIIDVGEKEAVEKDQKVLAGGFLIGKIATVESKVSKVSLFGKAGEKTRVLIGPRAVEVEATGLGSGNFRAQLPKEVNIAKGDIVLVAEPGENFLGAISEIFTEETNPFQTVIWQTPVNPFLLKWVEVLTGVR